MRLGQGRLYTSRRDSRSSYSMGKWPFPKNWLLPVLSMKMPVSGSFRKERLLGGKYCRRGVGWCAGTA